MKRILIRCKSCKSTYDVTDFEPGSKVQCGVCSVVLTVPDAARQAAAAAAAGGGEEAPAPPRPARPQGGSRTPGRRPARKGTTARTRARRSDLDDTQLPDAARRHGAPRRPSSRNLRQPSGVRAGPAEPLDEYDDGERPRYHRQKSQVGLYLSLGAVGVIVIFGLLWFSGIIKPKDPFEVAPEDQGKPPPTETYAELKERFETNYEKLMDDLQKSLSDATDQAKETSADNALLVAGYIQTKILMNAETLQVPEDELKKWNGRVEDLARTALKYEDGNGTAHRILGEDIYWMSTHITKLIDEQSEFPPQAMELHEKLLDSQGQWRPAGEVQQLLEDEKTLEELLKQGIGDYSQFQLNCFRIKENFKFFDTLKGKEWDFHITEGIDGGDGHFVLFEEHDPDRGDDVSDVLKRKGEVLENLYTFMEREYYAPISMTRNGEQPLVVISLSDRPSYVEFVLQQERDQTEESARRTATRTLGYYSRETRYFTVFNDISASQRTSDEEVLMHEATHQIEDAFSGLKERPGWRVEGWADYMSSFDPDTILQKHYWEFDNSKRLMEVRAAMDILSALPSNMRPEGSDQVRLLPPVSVLVGIKDKTAMLGQVLERLPPQARVLASDDGFRLFIDNLMYAEGCTFIYFMYSFQDGTYREKFQKFMQATFRGECPSSRKTKRVFAECMGFDNEDGSAWDRLDQEYLGYIRSIIGR